VNFVTAHDGFTLHDLVAYNDKHNEANGEGNRDGHSHNLSFNYGVEGPTDDAEVRELRFRHMRNVLATLLLSRGTPMILAGDEFARTQQGNNNAYCQDNEISWVNWEGIDPEQKCLAEFVQKLLAIRQALPMLRRGRFLTGEFDEELGVKDVTWLTPSGDEMQPEHWEDPNGRCMGVLLDGRAQETGIRRVGTDSTLLLIMNAHHDVVEFTLPEAVGGSRWVRLIDTNQGQNDDLHEFAFGDIYEVTGRSFLLFILKPARQRGQWTDADRSFQHVLDAFETAISTPVAFPGKSLLSMLNLPSA
jgi:glycogen operon protein